MELSTTKKILVVGPVLADWAEIHVIEKSLHFIPHRLSFIDPLDDFSALEKRADFYTRWREKLKSLESNYDAFIGFSLGGVILQENLDLLTGKMVMLFSSPSYIDEMLSTRLKTVIKLAREKSVQDAIIEKNRYVFSPHSAPDHAILLTNEKLAADRLAVGLEYVLGVDSKIKLQQTPTNVLHLIGEQSQLVNSNNVVAPAKGQLVIVPLAGMRVLQNNLPFCTDWILPFLNG